VDRHPISTSSALKLLANAWVDAEGSADTAQVEERALEAPHGDRASSSRKGTCAALD